MAIIAIIATIDVVVGGGVGGVAEGGRVEGWGEVGAGGLARE
jgi:hypothetical protein